LLVYVNQCNSVNSNVNIGTKPCEKSHRDS